MTKAQNLGGVLAEFQHIHTAQRQLTYSQTQHGQTRQIAESTRSSQSKHLQRHQQHEQTMSALHGLALCKKSHIPSSAFYAQHFDVAVQPFQILAKSQQIQHAVGFLQNIDLKNEMASISPLQPMQSQQSKAKTRHLQHASNAIFASQPISHCQNSPMQKAVIVPCRQYPLPEKKPVIQQDERQQRQCQIRPASSRLPLALIRKRQDLPSTSLPLPLLCWHDQPKLTIPNLASYIVYNQISANLAGIQLDPISFQIQTDMNSYCWSGQIELSHQDYLKIKNKLITERGKEPLIYFQINQLKFCFIAEEQRRLRQFAQASYTLSGRSVTARLGADYTQIQHSGLLSDALYASQIVQQFGNGLANVNFELQDWLIPSHTYAVTGKTVIGVLDEIANVAGGFLTSHPHDATLMLKPRYKVPAWQLNTSQADVVINVDIIQQINEQKFIQPRYNTVTLNGLAEGGIVYREQQNREYEAPTQSHVLYTDRDVIIPAGTAILSESGSYIDYKIVLRCSEKYHIPLAELGQIWQINDEEGAWRGIVTAIHVDVKKDRDAPTLWQTVHVKRYIDE